MSELQDTSRRQFIKKSAYVVPVIMTMHAAPSLAGQGSPRKDHDKDKHDYNRHSRKKKLSKSRKRHR